MEKQLQTNLLDFSRIAFRTGQNYLVLKQNFNVLASASYSVILSLSAYLLHNHPNLKPPGFQWNHILRYKFNNIDLIFNDLYQPWCDFIFRQIEKGKGFQQGDGFYMIIEVNQNYLNEIRKFDDFIQKNIVSQNRKEELQKVFEIKLTTNPDSKKRRIGIAYMGQAQNRKPEQCLKAKINLPCLISGIWFGNFSWKNYNILKEDYPSEEELSQLHALILTGSSHSVLDNQSCIQKLKPIIEKGLKINPSFRVYGICFGHQLLAKFQGGRIVKKESRSGIYPIDLIPNIIQKYDFLSPLHQFINKSLSLNQFNGDFVQQIPNSLVNLATGKRCNVQAFVSLDQRILGHQWHSQYSYQYINAISSQMSLFSKFQDLKDPIIIPKSQDNHVKSLKGTRKMVKMFLQREIYI